ncbi:VSP protein [Giardia muris]|uniref:VSP protein n=1 Tax=Giardia muris TaxID=5742 RepID=A0A4Z1SZY8_GIAMU|nr:VSP protein [Giardia muris]TNJ27213.1 VSP protein [Giardia muris]|eukprot:TNJ27212.1 VSP protein [Giardia muris]
MFVSLLLVVNAVLAAQVRAPLPGDNEVRKVRSDTCSINNCKTCNADNSGCDACNDGFLPKEDKTACYTCAACTNCATASSDNTCASCKTGYDTPASKCNTCASGYKPDSSTSMTQCFECTSCDHCTEASQANTCKTCATGYAVGTGTCDVCASGYLPDANNANCYSCSVPNCVQAKADGTCSKCGPAFFLSGSGTSATCGTCPTGCDQCDTDTNHQNCDTDKCSEGFFYTADGSNNYGTCTPCSTGCKTCTDATVTTCSACMPGYHPNSTTAPVSCTACDLQNCGSCTTDAATCDFCASGFGPTYNSSLSITACSKCPDNCESCIDLGLGSGLVCVGCPTGKNPINGECVDANTKVCTRSGPGSGCDSCLNGFLAYQGGCFSPQKAADLKICPLKNQLLVGSTTVCKECPSGFVPFDGTCTPLATVNKKTTRAAGANDICLNEAGTDPVSSSATRCGSCKNPTGSNSYFLFEGGCYPASSTPGTSVGSLLCSAASNGKCTTPATNAPFILDASSGAFTACPKECGACTSSTACSSCALGYYSNSTVTGPSDCTACPSGCTSCPNGKCTLCWDGSTPTNDACPPPPSSSSGLSGGAIAGIVIAVLLVLGGLGGFLGWWFGCRGK